MAMMVRMRKRGTMVTYLPVGDTPGICCSNPIAKKKMFAYLDQRIVYILLMITLNPPSELLKEKPWDEGKEVVLSRRDFVPFELLTLREVMAYGGLSTSLMLGVLVFIIT